MKTPELMMEDGGWRIAKKKKDVESRRRDRQLALPVRPNPTAAAREGGCARGCKSHPSSWTVHDGTARCLSLRKEARGVSSPGIELMGLNEDEPHRMSLVKVNIRRRQAPGWRVKADAGSANNRQSLSSPAGSAWQARWAGQPQIKRGERSR